MIEQVLETTRKTNTSPVKWFCFPQFLLLSSHSNTHSILALRSYTSSIIKSTLAVQVLNTPEKQTKSSSSIIRNSNLGLGYKMTLVLARNLSQNRNRNEGKREIAQIQLFCNRFSILGQAPNFLYVSTTYILNLISIPGLWSHITTLRLNFSQLFSRTLLQTHFQRNTVAFLKLTREET